MRFCIDLKRVNVLENEILKIKFCFCKEEQRWDITFWLWKADFSKIVLSLSWVKLIDLKWVDSNWWDLSQIFEKINWDDSDQANH